MSEANGSCKPDETIFFGQGESKKKGREKKVTTIRKDLRGNEM